MDSSIWLQISDYFNNNLDSFILSVKEHIEISLISLVIAIIIGVPLGFMCVKFKKIKSHLISIFQVLRIIPSLAILLLLIPVMGIGVKSAIIALVILAIPSILMNTVAGLEEVPGFMRETAYAIGMTERQVFFKVNLPLALPLIITGIKIAMIEIIASATLAAKIGAGGLGGIIFTGLGLNRMDLLLIGGISVGLISIFAGLIIDLIDKWAMNYKYVK